MQNIGHTSHTAYPTHTPVAPVAVPPPVRRVIAPPPPVSPRKIVQSKDNRICEWCASAITKDASCCPVCQKWRSDVLKARKDVIRAFSIITTSFLVIILLCIISWPKTSSGDVFTKILKKSSYPWHEEVLQQLSTSSTNGSFGANLLSLVNKNYTLKFSILKFLTSISGWGVIASVAFIASSIRTTLMAHFFLKKTTGKYYNC